MISMKQKTRTKSWNPVRKMEWINGICVEFGILGMECTKSIIRWMLIKQTVISFVHCFHCNICFQQCFHLWSEVLLWSAREPLNFCEFTWLDTPFHDNIGLKLGKTESRKNMQIWKNFVVVVEKNKTKQNRAQKSKASLGIFFFYHLLIF